MARVMPEAALYRDLTHFHRLLDATAALAKIPSANDAKEAAQTRLAPIRAVLDAGALQLPALCIVGLRLQ